MIRFIVPGAPIGKGRPRFSRATGRAYTPAQTHSYEAQIKQFAVVALNGGEPLDGPVALHIEAWFATPASWSKRKRLETVLHTSKPDADNIGKLVGDALNGLAWRDDSQVSDLIVRKRYTDNGSACLKVSVWGLCDG
jgi:Holliday junction resolvase RusA-like endonuclease